MRPVVWSIAGSDSAAGAGLQADLKALQAFGVHGCTAVAALTAQNSTAVTHIAPVSALLLEAQLKALAQDMPPQAIKTGLLGSAENLRVVCDWVDRLRAQGRPVALVVDPVLGATTGASFANDTMVQAYMEHLLPRATLVTPNRAEARRLWGGGPIIDGPSVVVTGGDDGSPWASDWMQTPQADGWLSSPRLSTRHHHGTGCTFASTAAAALASGYCVADAVVLAKMATTHALRHGYPAGRGAGPVCAQPDFAQRRGNLPILASDPGGPADPFPALSSADLGLYVVVDSAAWVERVLAAGVRTVQLRIKNPEEPTLAAQVAQAIAAARAVPGAQLFINDHWALALALGAYGVHLGQEDLAEADLAALQAAGLRLGISTHSHWEVARALACQPSYVACGPIFATQSKDMPWIPQGLDNLRHWSSVLDVPVVGIAGIGSHNISQVAAQGAAGAAVITAVTGAADPEQACRSLMDEFERGRCARRPDGPLRARPTL